MDGDGGLRDLVLAGEQKPSDGSGFSLELRDDGERMYNVTWGQGKGNWLVQSVGGDDYQLKWWDGELVPVWPSGFLYGSTNSLQARASPSRLFSRSSLSVSSRGRLSVPIKRGVPF